MSYTLDRFQPKAATPKSLVESIQEAAQVATLSGRLAVWVKRKKEQQDAQKFATESVKLIINKVKALPEPEEDGFVSPLRRILGKILRFCAKKIFKYVVRPIIRFAVRVAMNVVRFALQTVVRYVIVPATEFIIAFALANPITAALGAAILVAGGGYWIWNKFFTEHAAEPKIPKQDVDLRESPQDFSDISAATDVVTEAPPVRRATPAATVMQPETPKAQPTFLEAPVEYVKTQYKKVTDKGKGKKFTGFGDDVDAYIKEAAIKYKIPEDVLRGFVKMEAGWTGAMSPTGAIGTGQFIQPTWDGLAATEEGKEIGMTKIGKRFRTDEDPRFDKRINTLATGLLASQNAKILAKNGLPLTGENLYMMHNIGPGIIQVMLGKEASDSTLKAMSQNGMLKGQNASQFLQYQKGRFGEAYTMANPSTTVTNNTAKLSEGIVVDKKKAPVLVAQSKTNTTDKSIIRGPGKNLVAIGQV